MSLRQTYRDAVVDAIDALTFAAATTVEAWTGNTAKFNEDAEQRYIGVQFGGATYGPQQAIGGQVYDRTFYFYVYFSFGTTDADNDALTAMEVVEAGLPGTIATNRKINIAGNEEPLESILGRVLYRQRYSINHPKS